MRLGVPREPQGVRLGWSVAVHVADHDHDHVDDDDQTTTRRRPGDDQATTTRRVDGSVILTYGSGTGFCRESAMIPPSHGYCSETVI
jgi:hypothetical protein